MQAKFEKLVQVGIIVNNLENAVQNYEKMGISGWKISAHRNDVPPMEDLKYDGEEFRENLEVYRVALSGGLSDSYMPDRLRGKGSGGLMAYLKRE